MNKSDEVFFFTLVDFLLQVFFFGLLLYVFALSQEGELKKKYEQAQQESANSANASTQVSKWTGFPTLTLLNDFLNKLTPPADFRGWAQFMSQYKNVDMAREATIFVNEAGGIEDIKVKLKKYEEAYGLPPCVSEARAGKKVPLSVATIRLEDSHLEIVSSRAPEFGVVLASLGATADDVRRLTLSDFRRVFTPLRQHNPTCRYFVDVEVRSQYLAPMDALQSGFRIGTRR
jgi:hypothetical protein